MGRLEDFDHCNYEGEVEQKYSYQDMNYYAYTLYNMRVTDCYEYRDMKDMLRAKRKFSGSASPNAPYKLDKHVAHYCSSNYSYGEMRMFLMCMEKFKVVDKDERGDMVQALIDKCPIGLMWGFAKYEI